MEKSVSLSCSLSLSLTHALPLLSSRLLFADQHLNFDTAIAISPTPWQLERNRLSSEFVSPEKFIFCKHRMENPRRVPPGVRQLNLKKSFKLALRSLLTACPKEELLKAFPTFAASEQESLFRLFTQVISCLHENVEEEFDSLCRETQVETILDTVEQLVDEQLMDPLFSDKTGVNEIKESLSAARENEIQYLREKLREAEEKVNLMRAHVERQKERDENANVTDSTTNAVEKFKSQLLNNEGTANKLDSK